MDNIHLEVGKRKQSFGSDINRITKVKVKHHLVVNLHPPQLLEFFEDVRRDFTDQVLLQTSAAKTMHNHSIRYNSIQRLLKYVFN